MKQLILAICSVAFLIVLASLPKPVFAVCLNYSKAIRTTCPLGQQYCGELQMGGTYIACCTTLAECTALPNITPNPTSTPTTPTPTAKICDFAGTNKSDCDACANGTGKYSGQGPGVWTALGCIPTDPQKFIGQILGIAVGIGGGIAFLLILFGGFQILMSAGNPEKLNAGKELITSAITGLLIIIFSLFILRLIGFNIFAIPGFG